MNRADRSDSDTISACYQKGPLGEIREGFHLCTGLPWMFTAELLYVSLPLTKVYVKYHLWISCNHIFGLMDVKIDRVEA